MTVVIIQCYFGRSHETGFTVVIIQCYFDRSHETGLTVVIIQCYVGVKHVSYDATVTLNDAEARKHGEQTGLDTLVVHAVNDEC